MDVVVDIGNTRIKWGRCGANGVTHTASLPFASADWQRQIEVWSLTEPCTWAVSGVVPQRCDILVNWLRHRGNAVWVVDSYKQLPLTVNVQRPEKVGIDRLLNAVAAAQNVPRGRLPAIVVDVGSAVTVDWVESGQEKGGRFRGGAIMPGFRLMAHALHDYTAMLPLLETPNKRPYMPGLTTEQAIEAGIFFSVLGGVNTLIRLLVEQSAKDPELCLQRPANPPHLFLTGGDAHLLRLDLDFEADHWPEMTLEGIRLTADAQPPLTENQ